MLFICPMHSRALAIICILVCLFVSMSWTFMLLFSKTNKWTHKRFSRTDKSKCKNKSSYLIRYSLRLINRSCKTVFRSCDQLFDKFYNRAFSVERILSTAILQVYSLQVICAIFFFIPHTQSSQAVSNPNRKHGTWLSIIEYYIY